MHELPENMLIIAVCLPATKYCSMPVGYILNDFNQRRWINLETRADLHHNMGDAVFAWCGATVTLFLNSSLSLSLLLLLHLQPDYCVCNSTTGAEDSDNSCQRFGVV